MLQVSHITKKYGKVFACDDVTFSLDRGSVTVLLGPNGAGKSTVLKSVIGVLRYTGEIAIDGLYNKSVEAKRLFGYVPEIPSLYPNLTVSEHVEFIARAYRLKDYQGYADELFERFELADKKKKFGDELSKGMQQKLNLILGLVTRPQLLIMDEPTAGLDIQARNDILDLLRQYLLVNDNCSILLTSHISSDLEGLCDDIYLLHDGKIIFHEDTDTLLDSYAILKMNEDTYGKLDKSHVLATKKEQFGYACFTDEKRFYAHKYPDIVIENGSIDDMILMLTGGR